jgi:hypothetical protein
LPAWFSQPRRAKDQQVIERVAAQLCRLDKNLHLRTHLRLTDILCQQFRADCAIGRLFKPGCCLPIPACLLQSSLTSQRGAERFAN